MNKRKAAGKAAGKTVERRGSPSASRQDVDSALDLDTVRKLAKIATDFDLAEVEADPSGRVRVSRRTGMGAQAQAAAPSAEARATAPATLSLMPSIPEPPADAGLAITSPFVGTFYRSPSPEAAVYVDVGQSVRKGQVVCIVEAMKLMNEIESEVDGKIVEILAKNGAHVEYGQPLFRLAKA